jgi:hypothetical protein
VASSKASLIVIALRISAIWSLRSLYEDLVALGKSAKLVESVQRHERVVNLKNLMTGKPGRRGDGTFGELVPAAVALTEKGNVGGARPGRDD